MQEESAGEAHPVHEIKINPYLGTDGGRSSASAESGPRTSRITLQCFVCCRAYVQSLAAPIRCKTKIRIRCGEVC